MSNSNSAKKYDNVNNLILHDKQAKNFYMAQPDYIMGQINLHSSQIHSISDLKSFVKNVIMD